MSFDGCCLADPCGETTVGCPTNLPAPTVTSTTNVQSSAMLPVSISAILTQSTPTDMITSLTTTISIPQTASLSGGFSGVKSPDSSYSALTTPAPVSVVPNNLTPFSPAGFTSSDDGNLSATQLTLSSGTAAARIAIPSSTSPAIKTTHTTTIVAVAVGAAAVVMIGCAGLFWIDRIRRQRHIQQRAIDSGYLETSPRQKSTLFFSFGPGDLKGSPRSPGSSKKFISPENH
jgi:hypothetical protein